MTLKQLYKDISLIFITGMMYMTLEGFWRGWTNIAMLFVGGICVFLVGKLDESDRFGHLKIYQQSIIGVIIVLLIEFLSGIILNVWLGFHIWDYSDIPGNIYGQICPLYGIFWFLLMPLCIYIDDWTRYMFFQEDQPKPWFQYYIDLVVGR